MGDTSIRIVAWNCNMALHRKLDALLSLGPDIAVVSECADPEVLRARGLDLASLGAHCVWVGRNRNKGLSVLAFNGYRATLAQRYQRSLKFIAPVHIAGPLRFNLLAVWAQNFSGGVTRKRQPGPLRLALHRYADFLADQPLVVAGDLNNNVIWDKPGWLMNHHYVVDKLADHGLVSAYHAISGEAQGEESMPTHYWRDRKEDGPTYHLDYVFAPSPWVDHAREMEVGSFEDWCGSGLSDHVPVVVDVDHDH